MSSVDLNFTLDSAKERPAAQIAEVSGVH